MQSNRARAAVLLIAVAAVVVLFIVLSGDDEEPSTVATQPATAEGGGTGDGTKPAGNAGEPSNPEPSVPVIVIEDGQPKGGVAELSFTKGDAVSFVVESEDTSAEVHVHTYDVIGELAPGEPARIKFGATIEGVFEVELEETATQIAELEVNPE